MGRIADNFKSVQHEVRQTATACGRDPESVTLIGVSKRKSVGTITQGIEAGADNLGENYIQEAVEKIDIIGRDRVCWHFIGHLQSNKAKFAVKYFDYIHTVDSVKLAREIDKQAQKIDKIQTIFMEVNIALESTKTGLRAKEALDLAKEISRFDHLSLRGLMCMPPFFDDPEEARGYFRQLAGIKKEIREAQIPGVSMDHLSMGMSNDFKVAIEEGSTMVRVGTAIFGSRN